MGSSGKGGKSRRRHRRVRRWVYTVEDRVARGVARELLPLFALFSSVMIFLSAVGLGFVGPRYWLGFFGGWLGGVLFTVWITLRALRRAHARMMAVLIKAAMSWEV